MAQFLAHTRTKFTDFSTHAEPKGMVLSLHDVLATFRRFSDEGAREIWGLVATPTDIVVGLLTENVRLLGADTPYARDSGGRKILSFFGIRLEPGDAIPSYASLDGSLRALLKEQAEGLLATTWTQSHDAKDTSDDALPLPVGSPRRSQPIDVNALSAVRWPIADAEALWEAARTSQLVQPHHKGASVVMLDAAPSAEPALDCAFLAVATNGVSERQETARTVVTSDPFEEPDQHGSGEKEPAGESDWRDHRASSAVHERQSPSTSVLMLMIGGVVIAIGAATALAMYLLSPRR